jgi:hypothetical protein
MTTQITDEWNDRYNTHSNAHPVEHRAVTNALVVKVETAHLRGSDFSGVFEVAAVPKPFSIHDGQLRVQVQVGWFGMKPKTTWSHLTLNGEWELIRDYSGDVVHNLADK